VGTALALASLGLGYTFSSILQAGFYWAILFKHRAISDMLLSSGGGRLGRTPMKYAKQPLRTVADVSSFRTARATTAVQGTLQESALHGILNDERYDPRNRPDLQPQQPVTATETAAPATNGSYPPLAPTQGPGGSQPASPTEEHMPNHWREQQFASDLDTARQAPTPKPKPAPIAPDTIDRAPAEPNIPFRDDLDREYLNRDLQTSLHISNIEDDTTRRQREQRERLRDWVDGQDE
jgi:hypothetical protein